MTFFFQLQTLFILLSTSLSLSLQAEVVLKSWVESANDSSNDFPIQNLPYGIFKPRDIKTQPRIGVAIGNYVIDLKRCMYEKLFSDLDAETCEALDKEVLNDLMKLTKEQHSLLRNKITNLLEENCPIIRDSPKLKNLILYSFSEIDLLLPIQIGDYTDFYASIHHATHVGSIMRPDNPLMPNYKHMPIGYHGRSSSIVVSKTPVFWPSGQILNSDNLPKWSPSLCLDYELEVGAIIGKGNQQGDSIHLSEAENHIFGFVLLNDWSARDIQKWEYQPLGPFNGKNFATTLSPWVVSTEALKPFQTPSSERSKDDPALLDYLSSSTNKTFDIVVEAYLSSENMRKANIEPILICKGNLKNLYWSFDQMVCHHTSGGCNLRTGDLLGSGTISGETIDSLGCLLERIAFKLPPLELPDGSSRKYLDDGDEIILHAFAQKEGYPRIGFGECRGIVSKRR